MTGLTQTELATLLQARDVNPDLIGRVESCLMLSEMGRYAPGSANSPDADILAETQDLIRELELALRRKA